MNYLGNATLGTLDDAVYSIIVNIGSVYDVAFGYAQKLFFLLATIEILFFAINMMMGKDQSIASIVMKFLSLAVLSWVFINLDNLAFTFSESISRVAESLCKVFSNSSIQLDSDSIYTPSGIFRVGNAIISNIEDAFRDQRAEYGLDKNLGLLKMNFTGVMNWTKFLLIKVLFWIVFAILILQLALAQIEFHITLFFSVILYPFMIFSPTKFIGEKIFPAIVGQGIRLALVVFVTSLSMSVLASNLGVPSDGNLDFPVLMNMLFIGAICAFLAMQTPAIASTLLSGMPNLTAGSFGQNMAGLASALRGGMSFAKGKGTTAASFGKEVVTGSPMQGQGSQAAARVARAAGRGAASAGKAVVNNIRGSNSVEGSGSPGGEGVGNGGAVNNFKRS